MTSEQIEWLGKNPNCRPIGATGGFSIFTKRGTLRPDGTFVPATKTTPIDETGGSFGVGVLADRRDVAAAAGAARPRGGFQTSAAAAKTPMPADDRPNSSASPPPGPLPRKI